MTEPVLSRFGVHFIRLIDRREVEPRDFESVKAQMIKQLKKPVDQCFAQKSWRPFVCGRRFWSRLTKAIANEMLERLLGQR